MNFYLHHAFYYSFVTFGKLYALGTQVKTTVDEPLKDFYAEAIKPDTVLLIEW